MAVLRIRDEPYLIVRDDLGRMRAVRNYVSGAIGRGACKTIVELVETDQRGRGDRWSSRREFRSRRWRRYPLRKFRPIGRGALLDPRNGRSEPSGRANVRVECGIVRIGVARPERRKYRRRRLQLMAELHRGVRLP